MKYLIKNAMTTDYLLGQSGDELVSVNVLIENSIIKKISKQTI